MCGNNKPTIVFLNHWARRLGGAEHSLLDLLSFAKNRFDCHVITTESGILIDKVSNLNIKYHIVPCNSSIEKFNRYNMIKSLIFSWYTLFYYFKYLYMLRRIIKNINPQLIHANIPKSHISILILLKCGINKNVCLHIREIFNPGSIASYLYTFLFSRKRCHIIAISKSVRSNLPKKLIYNTAVIYNGINVANSGKKYTKGSKLKLLYMGRIVPWKGCHFLLEILSLLRINYPLKDIMLSLVGDTMYWSKEYRSFLEMKIKELDLTSCCHLLPHTENPELIYKMHDIFCNSSQNEPFGRVIVEAQSLGLPVVAFNSGGISEIIENGQNGFLVPYGRIDLFSNALGTFIQKPDLIKTMGKRGRKRTKIFFNYDQQCETICNYLTMNINKNKELC
jgi:glycosyltransferase involved in cell wall biosynthesis